MTSQDNSNHDQSKPKWMPPDQMWIRLDHLTWCPDGEVNDFEYLLATPQRKAAPELYEALEACRSGLYAILSQYENEPKCYEFELADKALAKARGEK